MKYLLLIALLFIGCSNNETVKTVKIYVDANGTETVVNEYKLPRVNLKKYYVCDENTGLVYISNQTYYGYTVYTPLLWNGTYLHQTKCSDLDK